MGDFLEGNKSNLLKAEKPGGALPLPSLSCLPIVCLLIWRESGKAHTLTLLHTQQHSMASSLHGIKHTTAATPHLLPTGCPSHTSLADSRAAPAW